VKVERRSFAAILATAAVASTAQGAGSPNVMKNTPYWS
jgi:hypothetical protein